jgi:dolichyl-phosphate beta-glucosyltransferase
MCDPITPPRLSIVIPALDEASRLPGSLRSIDRFLSAARDLLPAEIVVVDDGSTDDTLASARAVPLGPEIRMLTIRHRRNRGKGAAVRSGFARTSGEVVLLSDADLSAPIEETSRLIREGRSDTVVIGSRALDRSLIRTPQPLYRDVMGRCFNVLVRVLVLPGIHDTQCGFKLFPGAVARDLARVQRLDGFAYDVELLAVARHWGLGIVERGVWWRHVEASRVMPGRHSLQMLRDLLRLACRRALRRLPERPPPR